MNRIKTLIIPVLIIFSLSGLLLKYKNDIANLKSNIDKLSYKVEKESVLKDKYFTMLKLQIMHVNERLDSELILTDIENSSSYNFFDIVNSNDLVLSIPEYSCSDCIEKTIWALKNSMETNTQRIIVLSVFYDKNEQFRFFKTYNISKDRWLVFSVESKYFWNISNNRILLFKVTKENKFLSFMPLDGEFDELLETFIKFKL